MSKKKPSKASKSKPAPNMLVEDPYGFSALEVTREQDNPEELDLNEETDSPEVDIEQLERLNEAMVEEAEKAQEEAEKLAAVLKDTDPDTVLAQQIAEDQALAAEIAKEQAEAEARGSQLDPEIQAALPNAENLDAAEIQSCLESLLFICEKPVSRQKLQEWLGPDFADKREAVQEAIEGLQKRYASFHHGIELVEIAGGFQFRTKPARAPLARQLAKVQTQRLSSGGMETLAIIAYKQPVMKEEIDRIRGVDSSYFLRGLLDRKLIKISGRSELPGRPSLYATTHEFLEIFGLRDLESMPPLHEIESMIPASQTKTGEDDPRVKEMRKLVGQMKSDTSTTLKYDPREDEQILQDIRERVSAIPISTPTLDQQNADAKAQKDAAKLAKLSVFGDLGQAAAAAEPTEALATEAPLPPPAEDESDTAGPVAE
jgi:segregation and condensation protein B